MDKLPNTVSALIKQLDASYPHVRPKPGQTLDAIMYAAGARALVEKLVQLLDPTEE